VSRLEDARANLARLLAERDQMLKEIEALVEQIAKAMQDVAEAEREERNGGCLPTHQGL